MIYFALKRNFISDVNVKPKYPQLLTTERTDQYSQFANNREQPPNTPTTCEHHWLKTGSHTREVICHTFTIGDKMLPVY
jgi:hypothetical protein